MENTALITGGSRGIGLELAKIFGANETNLLLVARSTDKLLQIKEDLAAEYEIRVKILPIDLSVPESPNRIFEYTKSEDLEIEYLINNAGFGDFGYFADSNWNKVSSMINLNITSLTHLTKLYLPEMIERDSGKIMNVASTAAFQPGPLMAVYYASKAYVLHFSEAVNKELENTNVSLTALCPGATETNFQERADMENSKFLDLVNLDTSRKVAKYGYQAMQKGKSVAIPGLLNKLGAFFTRLFPRNTVAKVVKEISEPKD